MVCNRIYSVCLCFGWIAVFYFQGSRRVRFRRRCGFESHLLLGWFVSAHTDLPVLMCRSFGCRFLPAFLHRHHHPRLRIPRYSSSGFLRFSACRLGCRAVSHPIGRTFRPALSGSVDFSVLLRHLLMPRVFSFFLLGLKQWSRNKFSV